MCIYRGERNSPWQRLRWTPKPQGKGLLQSQSKGENDGSLRQICSLIEERVQHGIRG